MNDDRALEEFFRRTTEGEPPDYGYSRHPTDGLLRQFIDEECNEEAYEILGMHIATCKHCAERTAALRKEQREMSAREPGEALATEKRTLLRILREYASERLKRHIVNAIFNRLEALSLEERSELELDREGSVIPGMAAVSGHMDKETEHIMGILQELLPHEEELNVLFQESSRDEIQAQLAQYLSEANLADQLIEYL